MRVPLRRPQELPLNPFSDPLDDQLAGSEPLGLGQLLDRLGFSRVQADSDHHPALEDLLLDLLEFIFLPTGGIDSSLDPSSDSARRTSGLPNHASPTSSGVTPCREMCSILSIVLDDAETGR